jgi:hypothetical protein
MPIEFLSDSKTCVDPAQYVKEYGILFVFYSLCRRAPANTYTRPYDEDSIECISPRASPSASSRSGSDGEGSKEENEGEEKKEGEEAEKKEGDEETQEQQPELTTEDKEKLEKEKEEKEKEEKEREEKEKERLEQERIQKERERQEKEKEDQERQEKERFEKEIKERQALALDPELQELSKFKPYATEISTTTEEDVLLSGKLETFKEILSLDEAEKLASFLTVPFLRIPLILNFFADNRLGLLLKEDIKVVFETSLFQTHTWTPEAIKLSKVPASQGEAAVMGTRYGLMTMVCYFSFATHLFRKWLILLTPSLNPYCDFSKEPTSCVFRAILPFSPRCCYSSFAQLYAQWSYASG